MHGLGWCKAAKKTTPTGEYLAGIFFFFFITLEPRVE